MTQQHYPPSQPPAGPPGQRQFRLPPPLPPGARFNLPANALQRAAIAIAIIGLGTPAYWLILRFATNTAGWVLLMYIFFASWIVLGSQVALLIPTIMRARRTSPAAGGPISTPLMLAAMIVHVLSALFLGDFGDAPDQAVGPWITRVIGLPESIATLILGVLLLGWLSLQISAIVLAFRESSLDYLQRVATGSGSASAAAAGQ